LFEINHSSLCHFRVPTIIFKPPSVQDFKLFDFRYPKKQFIFLLSADSAKQAKQVILQGQNYIKTVKIEIGNGWGYNGGLRVYPAVYLKVVLVISSKRLPSKEM
jgi:hypothetical protein